MIPQPQYQSQFQQPQAQQPFSQQQQPQYQQPQSQEQTQANTQKGFASVFSGLFSQNKSPPPQSMMNMQPQNGYLTPQNIEILLNADPLADIRPDMLMSLPNYNTSCSQCTKHNLAYTQYCTTDHEPLCDICVGEHIELHTKSLLTPPNYIPIGKALDEVRTKMAMVRDNVVNQMKKLNDEDVIAYLEEMVQQITGAKKAMIAQVSKIAESRLKDIEIIETNYRKVQIKKPFNQAAQIINKYILNLQREGRIEQIQYAYLFDDKQFVGMFEKVVLDNMQEMEKSKCQLIFDYKQYNKMIQKCLYLKTPDYIQTIDTDTDNTGRGKRTGNKTFEAFETTVNKAVDDERDMKTQGLRKLIQSNDTKGIALSQNEEKRIEEQNRLKKKNQSEKMIIEDTTFPSSKKMNPIGFQQKITIAPLHQMNYVHYFETASNRLHLYCISEAVLQTRILKSDPIPYYHRSVQTSNSCIFLSGGKVSNNKLALRNTNLWMYNITKNSFKYAAKKLLPRSSHTLVQHKGYLYILGGFSQHNFERIVERVQLPEPKIVTHHTPSKFGGECLSASVGDNIWKISMDGLEIYNPDQDYWVHAVIKVFPHFQNCMCAAINQEQVFVFGGYDQLQIGVKNTHVITLRKHFTKLKQIDEQTFEVTHINKFLLAEAEGFSDNSVAMTNGNIYCWINDSNDLNEVRTDKKSLIIFDSSSWRYLPYQDPNLDDDEEEDD